MVTAADNSDFMPGFAQPKPYHLSRQKLTPTFVFNEDLDLETIVGRSHVIKGPSSSSSSIHLQWISIYMMDYMKGTNVDALWMLGLLKPEEQDAIVNDMAAILTQLREFHSPKDAVVASAQGRAILDYRIGSHLVGPFQSHASFHPFLRVGVQLENTAMNFGELQPVTTAITGR
ncbi:hypothetical protein PAAG_12036 [Paracoccidioides lutzii Pb01]|uniref:Uncharacterized protein n=1 Tax=Paracoccidioides lutzii (strain ATCC MYA-826 / Pb01) TaxID=502779 RepID=A0A0A2V556_PARBA|nr:hypothetical protein PAAG_12036 [Paracoccidioides lutzii Pb01]KGQ01265.1 hypothetical protein PAAG_12036 [Paracoccidioides lutzii Pb01]